MADLLIKSIRGGVTEYFPDEPLTFAVKAGQTVRGGRLVEMTADFEVQEAAADSAKVVGIALHDADGDGTTGPTKVTVANEGTWPCLVLDAGGVAAGDKVQTAAGGTVQNGGTVTNSVGKVLAAGANGATVPVLFSGVC